MTMEMTPEEIIREVWPDWNVLRRIGRGSFGDVFECEKQEYDAVSRSAVKVISIPRDDTQIPELRAEGIREDGTGTYFKKIVDDCVKEIKMMESLKGESNIVYVEDFKVIQKPDGISWVILIRMELLTGFAKYLETHTMNEAQVLDLGIDICTALDVCYKKNIIHRDIKPANIMVTENGHFKLGDFGIARELSKRDIGLSAKGTYNYMAPEIRNIGSYDQRVDIYSLGIVLYQLLNNNCAPLVTPNEKGEVTYEIRENAIMRRMQGESFGPPCNAHPAAGAAILKACAFDAGKRFSTPEEMKGALIYAKNHLNDPAPLNGPFQAEPEKTVAAAEIGPEKKLFIAPISNPPGSEKPIPTPPPKKPNRILYGIIALAVLIVALLAVLVFVVLRSDSDPEPTETTATKTTAATAAATTLPPAPTTAPMTVPVNIEPKVYLVVTPQGDPLVVRRSTTESAEKVGEVPNGAQVYAYFTNTANDWIYIKSGEVIGWARAGYVRYVRS